MLVLALWTVQRNFRRQITTRRSIRRADQAQSVPHATLSTLSVTRPPRHTTTYKIVGFVGGRLLQFHNKTEDSFFFRF